MSGEGAYPPPGGRETRTTGEDERAAFAPRPHGASAWFDGEVRSTLRRRTGLAVVTLAIGAAAVAWSLGSRRQFALAPSPVTSAEHEIAIPGRTAAAEPTELAVRPGPSAAPDAHVAPSPAAPSVRGHVVLDASRAPVVGAVVALASGGREPTIAVQTTTDESGAFTLGGVAIPTDASIAVRAAGLGWPWRPLTSRELAGEPIEFALRPEARVSGRVRTEDGTPVEGIRVQLDYGGSEWWRALGGETNVTDRDGRYVLRGIDTTFEPEERFVSRSSRSPSMSRRTISLAAGRETFLDIQAQAADELPLFRVEGRVVDSAGRGVAAARVDFFGGDEDSAQTAADGSFALKRYRFPIRHPLGVFARAPGFVLGVVRYSDARAKEHFEIALEPGVAQAGVVVDSQGNPCPHAVVEAYDPVWIGDSLEEFFAGNVRRWQGEPNSPVRRELESVRADAEGRFRMESLPATPVTLRAIGHAEGGEHDRSRARVVVRDVPRQPMVKLVLAAVGPQKPKAGDSVAPHDPNAGQDTTR